MKVGKVYKRSTVTHTLLDGRLFAAPADTEFEKGDQALLLATDDPSVVEVRAGSTVELWTEVQIPRKPRAKKAA